MDRPRADGVHTDAAMLNSFAQVRAKLRTAAFPALSTPKPAMPLIVQMDALRMTAAPSGMSGSAFCTQKNTALTVTENAVSNCDSVTCSMVAWSATPALANRMSILPASGLPVHQRRRTRAHRRVSGQHLRLSREPFGVSAPAAVGRAGRWSTHLCQQTV